jgi:hypothetical protein
MNLPFLFASGFSAFLRLAMIVNAMQQLYYAPVAYTVVYLCPVPAALQNALVPHHIELLTGDRLFTAYGLRNITDAHLKPDGMSHGFQNLCNMICYIFIHDKYPRFNFVILLYIYILICSQEY